MSTSNQPFRVAGAGERLFKRLSSRFSPGVQQELRRLKAHLDIRRGRFKADEPEYEQLASLVKPGDWVIDIGANIGYYTLELAHRVGPHGRVLSVEPIPESVEILASVVRTLPYQNVSLFNMAASDFCGELRFLVPTSVEHSLSDYFAASASSEGDRSVYACTLDQIIIKPNRISFVKIDAENHEYQVIRGMTQIITRDRPLIVLEGSPDCEAARYLVSEMGYRAFHSAVAHSPNTLLRP